MTVKRVHLLFEQSGTFKREFAALGIPAFDYDIQNEYRMTDVRCDLFEEIEKAYRGDFSIFNTFFDDDLVFAFFPCIYFCETNIMYFMGTNYNLRKFDVPGKLDFIIERAQLRNEYYVLLLKLCRVCESRGLRLIIENPYNAKHFLRFNFPYTPAVIDMNRKRMGDYFTKPTQYFFINCRPEGKQSLQMDKETRYIRKMRQAKEAGVCSAERSMISPDYAHNFICDHILGIESGHTQPTLFDIN